MKPFPLLLFALLATIGCGDGTPSASPEEASVAADGVAEDLAALDSDYAATPLRNEHIDIHRVTLPPGASIPPHEGGPRVVYSLGSYELRYEADGTSEVRSFQEGDVHYHDAGVHSIENAGSTPAEFLVFERRGSELPAPAGEGSTDLPTPGAGAANQVLFDNDFAEVHRVTLQPGAQLPPHQGYARAIYALSGYTVEFAGEGGTREQTFEAGEAHYHDPGDHTVENAGDAVAEFLVVEFKR